MRHKIPGSLLIVGLVVLGLAGAAVLRHPVQPGHAVHGGHGHGTLTTPTATPSSACTGYILTSHAGGWWGTVANDEIVQKSPALLEVDIRLLNVTGSDQTVNPATQLQMLVDGTGPAFPQQPSSPVTISNGSTVCVSIVFGVPTSGGDGTAQCPFNGDLLFYATPGQPATFGVWPPWACLS